MGGGEVDTSELTNTEIEKMKLQVQRYLDDRDIDAPCLNVGADMRKINFCFKLMKDLHNGRPAGAKASQENNSSHTGAGGGQANITIVDASLYDSKETKDLKETLRQRDNEISALSFWFFFVL